MSGAIMFAISCLSRTVVELDVPSGSSGISSGARREVGWPEMRFVDSFQARTRDRSVHGAATGR